MEPVKESARSTQGLGEDFPGAETKPSKAQRVTWEKRASGPRLRVEGKSLLATKAH